MGSAVRVNTKIKEGNKERIQAFEGVVIAKKGTGLNAMFTVRKISLAQSALKGHSPLTLQALTALRCLKKERQTGPNCII